jgi:hypothetical protein
MMARIEGCFREFRPDDVPRNVFADAPPLARVTARRLLPSSIGIFLIAAGALPAAAQMVTGRVLEEGTDLPIASALVHLLDETGARVTAMPTDGAGRFTLQAPEPGVYRVEAVRAGYFAAATELFEAGSGAVVPLSTLVLAMDPEAIENVPVPRRMIVGRVLADGFEEPMASILVRAVDAGGDGVSAAMTDVQGRFRLQVPEEGSYRVEAGQLGLEPATREVVEVGTAQGSRVTLRLAYESVVPDPEAFRSRIPGLDQGRHQFRHRREQGLGTFLTPEMIAEMEDVELPSHVFFHVPGMTMRYQVTAEGVLPEVVTFQGWQCVHVIADHTLASLSPGGASWNLDLFDLDEIRGIEIYRSFREIPKELRESIHFPRIWPPNSRGPCGFVIIWTQVGW